MIMEKSDAKEISGLIKELFQTKGFNSEEYDGWIIPEGSDYAMRGYWYPKATESTGQLTIEVFINSEIIMVESFAGMGESGIERLKDAFASFVHHSFPTFLSAVWGVSSEEVTEESWVVEGKQYKAYIGTQGILTYDQKALRVPSSYKEKIKELLLLEPLDTEYSWFNIFYANLNGLDSYAEVSRNNIKWTKGESVLKSMSWIRSNNYYAVRQFIILKRD
jgi:hypothetical protein